MTRADHCWDDVIDPTDKQIYAEFFNRQERIVGPKPALLAIDLYDKVYAGGPKTVSELNKDFPGSCGINAWTAIEPTKQLFAAARAAGIPIIYTTGNPNPRVVATNRQRRPSEASGDGYAIRADFAPQPGDLVIKKERASGFFGTPLVAHLQMLGVRSLIMCGESTSGCLRASTVEGFSNGFHMTVVEECCFDRSMLSHKVALFDLHHKYADVMHVEEVVAHLGGLALKKAG
ncbi:MAG TPA: isochorismatase family protein [Alphaproteobacteria bacterium]|nr:isochorismatase family protein [Alphaproteobacteria bacterium]